MEARALVIRPSNRVFEVILSDVSDKKGVLDGTWLEPIPLAQGMMYVDEDLFLHPHDDSKLNVIATRLVQMVGLIQPKVWILGSVIVVGLPDHQGHDTSVPQKLISLVRLIEAGVKARTN